MATARLQPKTTTVLLRGDQIDWVKQIGEAELRSNSAVVRDLLDIAKLVLPTDSDAPLPVQLDSLKKSLTQDGVTG